MKKASHIIIIITALFLILGVPAICNAGNIIKLFEGDTDAVSSATLAEDEPDGEFYILINKKLHPDTLDQWEAFFKGGETGLIFEDINCTAMDNDHPGLKYADHCKARLPENQMTIDPENSMIAISKLQWGDCDIFIISDEAAQKYHLEAVDDTIMKKIFIKGGVK